MVTRVPPIKFLFRGLTGYNIKMIVVNIDQLKDQKQNSYPQEWQKYRRNVWMFLALILFTQVTRINLPRKHYKNYDHTTNILHCVHNKDNILFLTYHASYTPVLYRFTILLYSIIIHTPLDLHPDNYKIKSNRNNCLYKYN